MHFANYIVLGVLIGCMLGAAAAVFVATQIIIEAGLRARERKVAFR